MRQGPLFDADNFMGILTQHMYKAPVPIRALVPEINVPPGLDAIVLKALSKKPEGRYQSMDELVADLEKLEQGMMPDAVGEMMARSGGFNVPADYFRNSAMPALVPASPASPKPRWPLYATIGAVATLLGVIGLVVSKSGDSSATTAQPPSVAPSVPAPVAAPAPTPSATVALPPLPSAAPATHEVLVTPLPFDATVTRDGVDLGAPPVMLHLADGEVASLVVTHKGFKSKPLSVDATQARVTVKPRPRPSPGWGLSAGPPAKPAGGIDDVGDPFKRHLE